VNTLPTLTGAPAAELHFHLLGVAYQLLSIVFESARITLVQLLIQRKGLRLNPITVRPAARAPAEGAPPAAPVVPPHPDPHPSARWPRPEPRGGARRRCTMSRRPAASS